MLNSRLRARPLIPSLLLLAALFFFVSSALPSAFGQDFTMTPTQFKPFAVEPGGTATSTITISPVNGFNGSVALSDCVVTPVQEVSPPVCTVSPSTVTPPAAPTVTITTTTATPPTLYNFTITGTGPTSSHEVDLNLTVLAVTAEYTITVTTAMTPGSVHAGSGATAVITVTPTNGYTGNVTLSCSAISPTATPAPFCSFAPTPVLITGGAETATLTVTTSGPAPTTAISHSRLFYGLWLPLPGLALLAVLDRGRSRRRFFGLSLLCLLGALLLMPACGDNGTTNSSGGNGSLTPNNTYTFTLSGTDENNLAPSNTTPTTSLIVN